MGLTQRLGTIPLAIQTDSSNNVGIGATPTNFGSSYTVLDVYNGTVGGYLLARSPNVTGQISVDNNTAMYVQSRTNHPIVFAPNNSEKMRLTTAGNLGIGTNAPDRLLQISNTAGQAVFSIIAADNDSADIFFGDNANKAEAVIRFVNGSNDLRFLNGGTERMRINTSQGLVMADGAQILTTGGYYRLRTAAAATTGLFIQRNTWTGSGDASPSIAAETGYGIYTYTNGSTSPAGPYVAAGGTTWTAGSSDVRKKKNFETTQGLAEILQVEPIKYHFNEDDDNSKKRLGFKAQNILDLIPEMVSETGEIAEDGTPYLTVTPDYILPVLVKAIQELSAKVTALENK